MHTLDFAHSLATTLRAMRPEAARPTVHKLTPDGRSWLIHAPQWWPLNDADVKKMWLARPVEPTRGVIMGRTVDFPRRTAAFGVDYKYTGQVQHSTPFDEAPSPLRHAVAALCSDGEAPPFGTHNAALVNWYDAKSGEYMGAHSDDEKELLNRAPVVSLSWATRGHYRRFRFTAKKHVTDALLPDAWSFGPGCVPLRNGCLVVMGGMCQATHKHELMKVTKQLGESDGRRINLTLRAFKPASAAASRKRQRAADPPSSEAPAPAEGGAEAAADEGDAAAAEGGAVAKTKVETEETPPPADGPARALAEIERHGAAGVSIAHLATALGGADVAVVREWVEELQLDGAIYENGSGKYVPL